MSAPGRRSRRWLLGTVLVVFGTLAFSQYWLNAWRAVQFVQVLGFDGAYQTGAYFVNIISWLRDCNGLDQFQTKIAALERATTGQPGPTPERRQLARYLLFTGQFERADTLYRDLLKSAPEDPELLRDLGLLIMRRAEVNNCAALQRACIYPLPAEHHAPQDAAEANALFRHALERNTNSQSLRWLVHLSSMAMGDGATLLPFARRAQERPVPNPPRFGNGTENSDVGQVGVGKGGVMGDMDGDGWLDIVATGNFDPLGLWRNRGDRTFEDRSKASGLSAVRGGIILITGDIDNDGDLDLYLSRNGFWGRMPNVMLENDGHGNFTDVTAKSGTGNEGAGFVSAFADYDLDGDLDLFVSNMANPMPNFHLGSFHKMYGEISNALYRNRGDGTFEDVTRAAGLECVDTHLGAAWGDIDADGDPDLYATTYLGYNHLYLNQGDGTFVDVAAERGVREPWASFSGFFFDYDNDGDLDLFVPSHSTTEAAAAYHMSGVPPAIRRSQRLFRNDGRGFFEDVTDAAGLRVVAASMGANWGDVNNDGYPDFYISTGGPPLERLEPNEFFVSRGDGTFWNATYDGALGSLQKGHAILFGDLDGDGWEDIHVVVGGAWPVDTWAHTLYWNQTGQKGQRGHFAKVVLRGRKSNSHGVGSTVQVKAGGRTLRREVSAGGNFGANPFLVQVGLGPNTDRIDEIEVFWPASKKRQRFTKLPADQTILVDEDVETPCILPPKVSSPIAHPQCLAPGAIPKPGLTHEAAVPGGEPAAAAAG